jgi:hypothetical protein
MSSNDDKSLDSLNLSAAERAEMEANEHRRLEEMAKDVQRRYDPARLSSIEASAAGRAEKLDDATRKQMEQRLGTRFHDVRIVRGAFADRVTQRHRADAVTIGSTGLILLRDGARTNMKTPEGKALLAHELTHVKQAQRGMHFAKEQGSEGAAHEQEAESVERGMLSEQRQKEADPGPSLREVTERVIDRAMDLLSEDLRQSNERHGSDDG